MIINNAASRRDVDFWTKHLENTEQNDRAELKQMRGVKADTLREALLEMREQARVAPKVQNFMYHADFNPCPHERLTEADWERAFEIFEEKRGIPAGQPRVVYEHEKNGRTHRHVIWLRVDLETGRAFKDGLDAKVAHAAARQIEKELDLQKVIGPFDREEGTPRPPRAPEAWEMYRGMKTNIDVRDVTAEVTELQKQCASGIEFHAALETRGYVLAQGDRIVAGQRALMIIDPAGEDHHLPRRIEGMNSKQVNEFMRDVDREALPTIRQAQERQQQRKIEQLEADHATVRDEIAWQEALARSAIEKEQREGQFLAPEDRQRQRPEQEEARAGAHGEITKSDSDKLAAIIAEGQKRQAAEQERQAAQPPTPKPTAPELGRIDAGIRLAYSLTGTGQEFADALEDRGLIAARVTEAEAARLNKWERQRLKELEALLPAPDQQQQAPGKPQPLQPERSLFHQAANEITREATPEDRMANLKQQAEARKPHELTSAVTWMAQTGGVGNLTPELLDQAQASYDKWTGPKGKYGLADYVDYVQTREAERRNQEPGQAPLYEKYKAGELVVVDQWSGIHQLNFRNTGDTLEDREARLRDIDLAPLFNVTDAEIVMKNLSAHRQEEWRQQWEQKRQEALRAAQERHWPTLTPQPEHKSAALFNQAATEATRDDRTENLTGPAAQVWEAWRQTGSDKARAAELAALYGNKSVSLASPTKDVFAEALDDRGITFARATKEEAAASHRQAAFARETGNYAPRFKEGEIVLVTEARFERNAEPPRRVYKLDQSVAEKLVTRLDIGDRLQSIEATLQASDERMQLRREERTAERTERATDLHDRANVSAGKEAKASAAIRKAPARVIGSAFSIGAELSGLLFSAFDTPKSPRQQERDNHEGERATDRRNAEADQQIDFSKYTGERAQQQRNEQEQQAARDRQRENERER